MESSWPIPDLPARERQHLVLKVQEMENRVFDQSVERIRAHIPEEARVLLSPFAGMLAAMITKRVAEHMAVSDPNKKALIGVAERQYQRSMLSGAEVLTKFVESVDLSALEEAIQQLKI